MATVGELTEAILDELRGQGEEDAKEGTMEGIRRAINTCLFPQELELNPHRLGLIAKRLGCYKDEFGPDVWSKIEPLLNSSEEQPQLPKELETALQDLPEEAREAERMFYQEVLDFFGRLTQDAVVMWDMEGTLGHYRQDEEDSDLSSEDRDAAFQRYLRTWQTRPSLTPLLGFLRGKYPSIRHGIISGESEDLLKAKLSRETEMAGLFEPNFIFSSRTDNKGAFGANGQPLSEVFGVEIERAVNKARLEKGGKNYSGAGEAKGRIALCIKNQEGRLVHFVCDTPNVSKDVQDLTGDAALIVTRPFVTRAY